MQEKVKRIDISFIQYERRAFYEWTQMKKRDRALAVEWDCC